MSTVRKRDSEGTFAGPRGNGGVAPIPAVRMTTGSTRVDPKPTSTAAGHGLLTALTLTAMGRLPKVLLAIKSADRRDSALAVVAELVDATASDYRGGVLR